MRQLYACWIEDETSHCDLRPIATPAPVLESAGVDVSGRRIAWSAASLGERPSVHFCEFVPETGTCIEQRLSGSPAFQTRPAIDGHRVVWEDGRAGPVRVHGLELPRLFARRRVSWRAGRPFTLALRGIPGSSGALRFEIEALEGTTPAQAKATIVPIGRKGRRALLRGALPRVASARALWKIRAIGRGGLFSERVVELEIEPAHSRATKLPGVDSGPIRARAFRLTSILEGFLGFFPSTHDSIMFGRERAGRIGEAGIAQ